MVIAYAVMSRLRIFLVSAIVVLLAGALPAAAQDVVWTDRVNVTVSGTAMQKTGGCDGCDDAGARSQQEIAAGDDHVEFTVGEANTFWVAGPAFRTERQAAPYTSLSRRPRLPPPEPRSRRLRWISSALADRVGRVTNNVVRHNAFGIIGTDHGPDQDSIAFYLPASRIVASAIADGDASRFPAGNTFPSFDYFSAQFVSYAGGDYRLTATSVNEIRSAIVAME